MVAVTPALQPTFAPLFVPRLSEKPRLGHQLPTAVLYPGIGSAISQTATRLTNQEYDFCVGPRCSSKERDSESGLDYFGARYFSSAQGRFTSPDEFKGGIVDPFTGQDIGTNTALPYADITDPQTLNKYAYVRNNPLRYTDPTGHCIEDLCIGEAVVAYTAAAAVAGGVIYYGSKLATSIHDYFSKPAQAENTSDAAKPPPPAKDGRTADDELRRDANGKAIPDPEAQGRPHTQQGKRNSKSRPGETYPQAREFDENGKPVRDIDFTDHGRRDHPNPHEHPYDPETGRRGGQQPLPPVPRMPRSLNCTSDGQCK